MSSLSPLLGAFYLLELDRKMEKLDVAYFRYMDDILILAPTRWKLRKAVLALNETFNELRLEKHPDKTSMGRTQRGFDFLGYHFGPNGISLAEKTVANFMTKALRLYEQEPGEPCGSSRLGEYLHRWVRWGRAGVSPRAYRWANMGLSVWFACNSPGQRAFMPEMDARGIPPRGRAHRACRPSRDRGRAAR